MTVVSPPPTKQPPQQQRDHERHAGQDDARVGFGVVVVGHGQSLVGALLGGE